MAECGHEFDEGWGGVSCYQGHETNRVWLTEFNQTINSSSNLYLFVRWSKETLGGWEIIYLFFISYFLSLWYLSIWYWIWKVKADRFSTWFQSVYDTTQFSLELHKTVQNNDWQYTRGGKSKSINCEIGMSQISHRYLHKIGHVHISI